MVGCLDVGYTWINQWVLSPPPLLHCRTKRLGFDYSFNAIGGERDQIYLAVRRLLEIAFVNDHKWDSIIGIYFPFFNRIWVRVLNWNIFKNT